jgi:hypothetical protein
MCKKGQGRIIMHDRVKQEIAAMCRYAQVSVRQEPTDLYRVVDPDNGMRPDLEIRGLLERGIFADIAITEPICSSLTMANAQVPLRVAKIKEQQKNQTYLQLTRDTGNIFVPLVCETYGAWGPSLVDFFDKVIKHASESRGIPKEALSIYWRRRIAVTLHKAITHNIFTKNNCPRPRGLGWLLLHQ